MSSNPYNIPSSSPRKQGPRVRRIGWWVAGAVIVAVLIVGGAVAYFNMQRASTPQKTLTALCDAWKAHDEQSWNRLRASYMNINEMQWIDQYNAITAKDCTVDKVQVNGSTAVATLTITLLYDGKHASDPITGPVYLRVENGTWKVEML
jgi:outer membrane murein-binding lipoprotein Lpp